ncbi:MAG: hypothetical protein LAT77_07505 [Aliidiomarina sp.]|uniref:hypothetical protein n=1 Tax=Aliidiomarina sp. TaxID=1872439 RepID=UPI0025C00605|nr:hypothetical protein [Aliidiomarina sp.]MCH8501740.1 hypothetical protein [Aliidiomarina sp.]
MDMVERYIAAVKRELPSRKRDDIGRELEANIMDKIEALEAQHGQLNEAQVSELLISMGHPRSVAHEFCPPKPLVSVELMPIYLNTLYMVLGILFVISSLEVATRWLSGTEMTLLLYMKALASHFLNAGYFAFTWVTIGFIVMTRDNKKQSPAATCAWSPAKLLPAVNGWQHIRLQDIFTDLATTLFLALVIWYPILRPGPGIESIFNAQVWTVLLWFTPVIAIAVMSSLWQLRTRLWTPRLLMINIGVSSAFLAMALWMMLNTPILRISETTWEGAISAVNIERCVFVVVLFVAGIALYEIIRDGRRLLKLR